MTRQASRFAIPVLLPWVLCSCGETVSPSSQDAQPFWTVLRNPQVHSYQITGSSGHLSSGLYMVNDNGTVLLFDGADCHVLPALPAGTHWNCIWANPPRDVLAVGSGGAIARFNGSQWREEASGTSADLHAAWGRSGSDVWVAGDSGTVLHHDGSGWRALDTGTDKKLCDIHGLRHGPVFAVGEHGTILDLEGSRARTLSTGTTNSLNAIHGSCESDLCAVGANGTILHYRGGNWIGARSGVVTSLASVCATGSGRIYATGGRTLLQYDGEAWTPQDTGFDEVAPYSGVVDLYADISGRLAAVGHDRIYLFDTTDWRALDLPPSDEDAWTLSSLWCSGALLYAINGCSIMRTSRVDWSSFLNVSAMGLACELRALWGTSPTNLYAVGWAPAWDDPGPLGTCAQPPASLRSPSHQLFDNGMLIVHHDEAGLHVDDIGTVKGTLFDVWGASADDVFIVGWAGSLNGGPSSGAILHYDGSNWRQMQSTAEERLLAVWGSSGTDVFAAGDGGAILHYDGRAWSRQESGVDASLVDLWGSGPADVFAVGNGGSGGVILHYDGLRWSVMESPAAPALNAIWGHSPEAVYSVGDLGTTLRYTGGEWRMLDAPTRRPLYSICGNSEGAIFVGGADGVLLHHGVP